MSQIVNAITYFDTGERKCINQRTSKLFQDVFDAKSQWKESGHSSSVAKIYKIGVQLGCNVAVEDHPNKDMGEELQLAVERTKKQVIEAIFGEFRTNIRELEKALYDYDYETARVLLHRLEDQMFKVT